jgi:hypothetical protein
VCWGGGSWQKHTQPLTNCVSPKSSACGRFCEVFVYITYREGLNTIFTVFAARNNQEYI